MKIFKDKLTQKLFISFLLLSFYRLGNSIPLQNIDQEALRKNLLDTGNQNGILQMLKLYSSGDTKILSSFSLGIIPFINASILVDLFTSSIPYLEKLQLEEGTKGRKQLFFYKKILTIFFAIFESYFLLNFVKGYLYNTDNFSLGLNILELTVGSLSVLWISNLLDNYGIGNGTSFIILSNIVLSFLEKIPLFLKESPFYLGFNSIFLVFLILVISFSQKATMNIQLVSSKQLIYLENADENLLNKIEFDNSVLPIKLNQAGIFPLIIASNFLGFIGFYIPGGILVKKILQTTLYYFFIILFNYLYTSLFWDPEKISEQLRKASVSISNITPGKETSIYLEKVVKNASIRGGVLLCSILFLFEIVKFFSNSPFLNQLNISSLIIAIGVSQELSKTIKSLTITKLLNRIKKN